MDAADINVQAPTTRLVNGLLRPRFGLRSGETQLWRIANVGADLFYDVQLDRPSPARDRRGRLAGLAGLEPQAPGAAAGQALRRARAGRLARATTRSGRVKFDEGFQLLPTTTLAHVRVSGPAARPDLRCRGRLDTPAKSPADLPVRRKRTFTFSFDFKDKEFAHINGEAFNPHATHVAPLLGTVEEWTLRNVTDRGPPVPHPRQRLPGDEGQRQALPRARPAGRGDHPQARVDRDPQPVPPLHRATSSSTVTSSATRTAA